MADIKNNNDFQGSNTSGSYDGATEAEGQQRRRSTITDLNRDKNLDAKYVA